MNALVKAIYVLALAAAVLFTALIWWAALTTPAYASDGPIILSIFLTVCCYLLYRARKRVWRP